MPIVIPLILVAAGIAGLVMLITSKPERDVPNNQPDSASVPGKTGWKLVDAILPQLKAASTSSGVPLGLLVGWICKESGGRLGDTTKYDERGLFQLMPDESKKLGLDHQRLSTDLDYSINGGLALIGYYSGIVDRLGVALKGSTYYWMLVKLVHSMGSGATTKIVQAAQKDGAVSSWDVLEKYATAHNDELLHATKHSPLKWFPFCDEVYRVGAPFGFGTGAAPTIVGEWAGGPVKGGTFFSDIVDPLDAMN